MNRLFKRIGAGVLCGLLLMANTAYGETRIDGGLVETFKRIAVQASATLSSAGWVGLGAAKARLVFTDAAVDLVEMIGGVWKIGTVHYIGDSTLDLDAYIATSAVTAGDTLRLCHAGMTITDDIDVTKGINIAGQGIGKTTITCATASKNIFDVSASNVRIADLSVSATGDQDACIKVDGSAGTVLSGIVIENVNATFSQTTNTGTSYIFVLSDASGIVRECTLSGTSGNSFNHFGIQYNRKSTAEAAVSWEICNVNVTTTGTTTRTHALDIADVSGAGAVTMNVYNSNFASPGTTNKNAVAMGGASVALNLYRCSANGGTTDVLQNGGTLTLYDTTLVNGTTSGTITYGGTVVTGGLMVDPGGVLNAKIGHTSANFYPGGNTDGGRFAVIDGTDACMSIENYSATDANSGIFSFTKSGSATKGTMAATASGEYLGDIRWHGGDSGNVQDQGAIIRCIQDGAAGVKVPTALLFMTSEGTANATERMRIDNAGTVNIGGATTSINVGGVNKLELNGTAASTFMSINDFSTTITEAGYLQFSKSASATIANSLVAINEAMGGITWYGNDGNGPEPSAGIYAQVDTTPGNNDMPGRIIFSTTADGAKAVTERMRIKSTGEVKLTNILSGTPDEITATSDGVAASVTTLCTEVTTNGDEDLDNVTLANGVSGQIKHIYCVVEGHANDTWKVTPATTAGAWTTITFATAGEGCTLIYADNEGWVLVGHTGGTVA